MSWQILTKIGFSEKASKLYLAMLELGTQPVSVIAKKAGLNRTTTYLIINELKEKGLISEITKKKILYFSANSPSFLVKYLESQKNELNSQQSFIKQNLHLFESIINVNSVKPNVQFFEGFEGIKNVYMDTLENKKEIFSFAAVQNYPKPLYEYIFKIYIPKRIQSKIFIKSICPKEKFPKDVLALDKVQLRETKFFTFLLDNNNVEINIYGNKVAFIDFTENHYSGVIIENHKIANAMHTIHQLTWNALP